MNLIAARVRRLNVCDKRELLDIRFYLENEKCLVCDAMRSKVKEMFSAYSLSAQLKSICAEYMLKNS